MPAVTKVGAAAVTLLLVVGVIIVARQSSSPGSDDADDHVSASEANRAYAISVHHRPEAGSSGGLPATDLRGLLPNVHYEYEGREHQLSHEVIVGKFTRARPGRAYRPAGGGSRVVDWDDARWEWRTVFVTVEPEDGGAPVDLEFTVYPGDDPDRFSAGMVAMGRVAVLTGVRPERRNEMDPDVKGVSAVITIADDGSLDLPFVADRGRAEEMLADLRTLDALLAAAAEPSRTVRQEERDGAAAHVAAPR